MVGTIALLILFKGGCREGAKWSENGCFVSKLLLDR